MSCVFGYTQHIKKEIVLTKVNVNNNELKIALDTIIEEEKECDYFSVDLMFGVTIIQAEEGVNLLIDSFSDKDMALGLDPYGYFYHRNHLFFVDGIVYNQVLCKTKDKKEFKYLEYDPNYKLENGKNEKIFVFTDDSFSQWEFLFNNKELTLKSKISSCD